MDFKRVPGGIFRVEISWTERPYDPNRSHDTLKMVGAGAMLLSIPWLAGLGVASTISVNDDWQGDNYVRTSLNFVTDRVDDVGDWARDPRFPYIDQ
jgi:hypothetical protein